MHSTLFRSPSFVYNTRSPILDNWVETPNYTTRGIFSLPWNRHFAIHI